MKPLKVESFGETVQGVKLRGDPKVRPEPESFRVAFPGGDVDIVRYDDGSYWIHVRVDSERDVREGSAEAAGKITDARVDYRERAERGERTLEGISIGKTGPYHLAVRVTKAP